LRKKDVLQLHHGGSFGTDDPYRRKKKKPPGRKARWLILMRWWAGVNRKMSVNPHEC